MIEGFEPIRIEQFLGLYSNGSDDAVPNNHLIDALNVISDGDVLRTREGSVLDITLANIVRVATYNRTGEAPRYLILTSSGDLYDSTDLVTPILSIASMTDFSLAVLFNRAYISPHNGSSGLSGEKVYVYNGTGTARAAAGSAPSSFTLGVADSALSGDVEAGTRLFAVAYETDSGFITAPGPASYTEFESAGSKKIDISSIPVGPSGTSKRHLICTKVIDLYDGNQDAQEYYFIPGGTINNNVDTTLTVDFFDADLVSSADYLFDQISEIPAALKIMNYQNSLVTLGENLYPAIVRVSKQGYPESFNGEIGFIPVETSGTPVKNCVEYRSQLMILKSNRTFASQRISGQEAGLWELVLVDQSVGTEIFGIGSILESTGNILDYFLVADRAGLFLFDGSYRVKLSAKIDTIWDTINKAVFNKVQLVIDPVRSRLYCAVPTGAATTPNTLLVADFSSGLTAESIRWFKWSFPINPISIGLKVNSTTLKTEFYYAGTNIYKLSDSATDDNSTAIDSYLKTALFTFSGHEEVCCFTGFRSRIKGSGTLQVTLYSEDGANSSTLTGGLALATSPGKPLHRPFNYVGEKCSLKLRVSNSGEWMNITNFHLYGTVLFKERPL